MSRISELSIVEIPLKIRIVRIFLELVAFVMSLLPSFLSLYLTDEMIEKRREIPYYWMLLTVIVCLLIHLFQFYFSKYKSQVYVNRVVEK